MCIEITYTLTCEHVKTEMRFCAYAMPVASGSGSSSSRHRSSGSSSNKKKKSSSSGHHRSSSSSNYMMPCANFEQQYQEYPTPPSFAGDPQLAATSLLSPKCPLPDCPFEQKNRRWNCCWCGKGGNVYGRCSCAMIIEGAPLQCEHICCPNCEAA